MNFPPSGILSTVICPGFATHGGIYDEMVKATGKKTPTLLGGTTAEAVAAAIERAIRKAPARNHAELPGDASCVSFSGCLSKARRDADSLNDAEIPETRGLHQKIAS